MRDFKEKEKTGVYAGFDAIHPATKETVPIWITNYVMNDVGTGAIMGVPAHDERDFQFAKKYNLPVKQVIAPLRYDPKNPFVKEWQTVERQMVQAVIRNPKDDTYLLLQWKELPWVTFPGGGLEEGESIENSALREIEEETGLKNLKYVATLPIVRSEYSANHKQQNRISYCSACVFEVTDKTVTKEVNSEELKQHEVIWKKQKDFSDEFVCSEWDVWKKALDNSYQANIEEEGVLINSDKFTGLTSEEARKKITEFVGGKMTNTYRIKDWVFSRQRYWGEPIPIIHCEKCGVVPVSEDQLPVLLPEVANYEPTGTGESPLADILEWINTTCPECGGAARRETNTMPQWAGSSWYYLRFIDPKNSMSLIASEKEKNWMPVDVYVGGDHATRHLIYARFWHKFLFDIGVVSTEEPFPRLEFLGFILAEDGRKMSKRWGNIINPDDVVKQFGADAFRLYEMFIGPFEGTVPWSTDGLVGTYRFLERVWRNTQKISEKNSEQSLNSLLHKTIKKVTDDIEAIKFNTAVSTLMIFANEMDKAEIVDRGTYKTFLQLLAPFAPHMTEELWYEFGEKESIHLSSWPTYDTALLVEDTLMIAVQINGKVRADFEIAATATKEDTEAAALALPKILAYTDGQQIKKIIVVPGKIVNIVI